MSKKTIITIAAILGALAVLFAVMFVVRICNVKTVEENKKAVDELNGQYKEAVEDYTALQNKINSYLPAADTVPQGEEELPADTGDEVPAEDTGDENGEEDGETNPLIGDKLEETKEAVDKELEKEQGAPADNGAAE